MQVIRSVMPWPEGSIATPGDTPLPVSAPEGSVAVPDDPENLADSGAGRNVASVRSLPWLTSEQNADRLEADRALAELRERQDIPADRRADLQAAIDLVTDLEGRLARADELLNRSRGEILQESDWRELETIVSSIVQQSTEAKARLRELLGELEREGELGSPAGRGLQELHERVAEAGRHLRSNDMRWNDTVRCLQTTLPVGRGLPVVVHDRVVEGAALGAHLAQGYPAAREVGRQSAASYVHIPELALTTLVDKDGKALFSGLRHALFQHEELTGPFLQSLADDDLRPFMDTFLVIDSDVEATGQTRTQLAQEHCDNVHGNDQIAAKAARLVADMSRGEMALETAAAALVADPDKFQRALDGETVDLNLHCVSLLDGKDIGDWHRQSAEFRAMARRSPVSLNVRGLDGAPRSARVIVQVRQTAVTVSGEHRGTIDGLRKETERLLGPVTEEAPGGAAGSKLEDMHSRAHELTQEIAALDSQYDRSCNELGSEHPSSEALLARRSVLQTEQERFERNARSLDDAARQLKQIWAERNDWPSGAAAREQVLPRLVLLGHWMGDTPVMSCRAGSSLARQLDGEVKFLAAATESLNGHLPQLEQNSEAWRQARRDFTAN
ncbi:MAG: hypothetical protein OXE40_00400 [Gammaproteobacteria bacterium]|nr:hypothetical protein [Gammaproteobacteria bacterium]